MEMVTRSWRRNWIVACALIVHGVWGLILLFSEAPLHTTPLGIIHELPIFSNRYGAACLYLLSTAVAAVPVVWTRYDTKFIGMLCCSPQQFLLMISFFTAFIAVVQGHYPDGYVPDKHGSARLFIFVDQLWPMVGMWMHTLSLLDWYWWSRFSVPESTNV